MQRPPWLAVWTTLIASVVLVSLLSTWVAPARQAALDQTAQDLQLKLLWLEDEPIQEALIPPDFVIITRDQYQTAYETVQQQRLDLEKKRTTATDKDLKAQLTRQSTELQEQQQALGIKLGILWAETKQPAKSLKFWSPQAQNVLGKLYGPPQRPDPTSERWIKQNLTGWYQLEALEQLDQRQGRSLAAIQLLKKSQSEDALNRWLGILGTRLVTGLLGLLVLGRELALWIQRKRTLTTQTVPWSIEDGIWVFSAWLTGFFVVPFVAFPVLRPLIEVQFPAPEVALAVLVILVKSGDIAVGMGALWYRILRFNLTTLPLHLRVKDLPWVLGGYVASVPLVTIAALISQQLVGTGGGGNQLLTSIMESKDLLTQGLLLFTVVILAPVFEEILFRGVLFSSLTKIMSSFNAMIFSGFVFGAIHMSMAELLPLWVLGILLAYCYAQTRNLLVPILIHLIFNALSFWGLLLLGGAN